MSKKIILLFSLLVSIFFLIFWNFQIKNHKDFEIIFVDTGQGNLTLVKNNNLKILIDTGREERGLKNLKKEFSFFDKKIDAIFLTHFDEDHVKNIFTLFKHYFISSLWINDKNPDGSLKREILKNAKKNKINIEKIFAGEKIVFNKNLSFEIIYPENWLKQMKNSNSSSTVLKIIYKNKSILITGDLPEEIEKYLAQRYPNKIKADILVAGHHGSKTSNSEIFLKTVNPKWIIISVGKDNSYGHPHQEVLQRIEKLKIPYFRTDQVGSIKFWVDKNENLKYETKK